MTQSKNYKSTEYGLGQHESQTMTSSIYVLSNDEYQLSLIDTPGLLDTRGIDNDVINIENILITLQKINKIHAICLVHKSTDSRIDSSFKYYTEEFKTIIPNPAKNNFSVCFTHAINLNKIDALSSLQKMEIPLKNLFYFENDCLIPPNQIENLEYQEMSSRFWTRNEKNYKRLLEFCEKIKPVNSGIFNPIIVYKTIFLKINLFPIFQDYQKSIIYIQMLSNEIADNFKENNIADFHLKIVEFYNILIQIKILFDKLKICKEKYEDTLGVMFKDFSFLPKNKYFQEYLEVLEKDNKIKKDLIEEYKLRVKFDEFKINQNYESEILYAMLVKINSKINKSNKYNAKIEEGDVGITFYSNKKILFVSFKKQSIIVYNSEADANGTLYYGNKSKWVGNISNSYEACGTGIFYYSDENRWEGEYNGSGTLYLKDGHKIVGNGLIHELNGNVKWYFNSGEILESSLTRNKISSTGTFFYKDGKKWVGDLKDNRPQGNGILYLKNNCRWEGKYPNDSGTYYFSSGDRWVGLVKNGTLDRKGTYYWKNGDYWVGAIDVGKLYGNGTLYKNGRRQTVKF